MLGKGMAVSLYAEVRRGGNGRIVVSSESSASAYMVSILNPCGSEGLRGDSDLLSADFKVSGKGATTLVELVLGAGVEEETQLSLEASNERWEAFPDASTKLRPMMNQSRIMTASKRKMIRSSTLWILMPCPRSSMLQGRRTAARR